MTLTAMLISCGLIPNLGCDIKMTNDYIESTCGLYNGVRFEELRVDTFYDDKTPKIYRVVLAFEGHLDESKTNDLNIIYFNNPSGKYAWWTDTTTNGLYRKWGIHHEQIDKTKETLQDTIKEVNIKITHDSIVRIETNQNINLEKYNSAKHLTCPIKFKPNTWYYITFFDQRYEAYLYVGNDMKYRIDKISLPTNY
jgi:hypothetical protein